MKKKGAIFPIALTILIIAISVASFLNSRKSDNKYLPEIMAHLINPYTSSILAEDYVNAYLNYTSEYYKENHSLKDFIDAQKANEFKYGKIISIQPLTGIIIPEQRSLNKLVYKCTYKYIAQKKTLKIAIEVVFENSGYKIEKTYMSFLTVTPARPEIF